MTTAETTRRTTSTGFEGARAVPAESAPTTLTTATSTGGAYCTSMS